MRHYRCRDVAVGRDLAAEKLDGLDSWVLEHDIRPQPQAHLVIGVHVDLQTREPRSHALQHVLCSTHEPLT